MIKPGWIDIIDTHDQVIKVVERTPTWDKTRADPHRCIQVYGITDNDQVVFTRRAKHLNFAPNHLDALVGGLPYSGEDYLACALRKVEAELGQTLSLQPLAKLCDINSQNGRFEGYFMLYTAKVDLTQLRTSAEFAAAVEVHPRHQLQALLSHDRLTSATRHAIMALQAVTP